MTNFWIKDIWHRQPDYRDTVVGMDIYRAVLEWGVQTPAEFERYLQDRADQLAHRVE